MRNVHLLPTNKPSRLIQKRITNELKLSSLNNPQLWNNINIYITSEEEPKDGEWVYNEYQKIIIKFSIGFGIGLCKKIILTTDPDLIEEGVQAIDNEFLEWFVKNPSCEFVEVFHQLHKDEPLYKIVIPKEATFINN
jgi:hypothetical protein